MDRLMCLVGVVKFISRVCGAMIAGIELGTGCEKVGIGCCAEEALVVNASVGKGHAGIGLV